MRIPRKITTKGKLPTQSPKKVVNTADGPAMVESDEGWRYMAVTADPSFRNPRNLGAADFREETTPLTKAMRSLATTHRDEADFRAACLRLMVQDGIEIFRDEPRSRVYRAEMNRIAKERWPQR